MGLFRTSSQIQTQNGSSTPKSLNDECADSFLIGDYKRAMELLQEVRY